MARSCYAGCFGSIAVDAVPFLSPRCVVPEILKRQSNGVFNDTAPIRFASVTDGASHTMFVCETAVGALWGFRSIEPTIVAGSNWWLSGNHGTTLASAMYPPNMFRRVSYAAMYNHAYGARSLHPSGLNVLMGDGSARFVRETVETWPFNPGTGDPAGSRRVPGGWMTNLPRPGVWQALATRSDGDSVPADGW